MELYAMLYQRLTGCEDLAALLAEYDGGPAIFYQRPATADDRKWGEWQYPRIDYNVDMQENPARNTSGVLSINVWCDAEHGAEPEDIERTLRSLLHAVFAQADDYPYSFSWARTDAFEVKVEKEQAARTIGVTALFDIMAYPSQITFCPDPIRAMNDWTKAILPHATVIGLDDIDGWLVPTRENPAIYWRLAAQGAQRKHFTHSWVDVVLEGYVCARSAADRLYGLTRINTAAALVGHIRMEDGSPLFLTNFTCKPHLSHLTQGQIQANGRFGILQPWYGVRPEPKLNHINIPREIVDGGVEAAVVDESAPYVFPYKQPKPTGNTDL